MSTLPRDIPRSLQDLAPQWAHFCLHIERFITEELNVNLQDKTINVAFSGGVDSTALLLVLHYLSKKNNGHIVAIHMDHQMRAESYDDALWTENLCKELSISYIARAVDVRALAETKGIGLEEAGRHARYNLFAEIMTAQDVHMTALGHHLDDLCEDVLMRLIRGAAWPGLAGMPGYDGNRQVIRPFLLTPKSQLINFLTSLGIPWREDSTNKDLAWTRNRVRGTILPMFIEENPNFAEAVARLWKVGQIDQDYWTEKTSDSHDLVSQKRLVKAHKATRLRLYKTALDALDGGQVLAETLFKLDRAWQENKVGSIFQFPGNKTATITASGVVFSAKH